MEIEPSCNVIILWQREAYSLMRTLRQECLAFSGCTWKVAQWDDTWRTGKSWRVGFGISEGCHLASTRISPEPRSRVGERRELRISLVCWTKISTLLPFGPGSVLWKTEQICFLLFGSLKNIWRCSSQTSFPLSEKCWDCVSYFCSPLWL